MIILSGLRQITIGQPQAYPGLAGLVEQKMGTFSRPGSMPLRFPGRHLSFFTENLAGKRAVSSISQLFYIILNS